jgi:hypothetical protein
MFCAPKQVFGGIKGFGSRFHVLCSRTRFGRFRGRQVKFSCLALSNPFWAVPRASGPVLMCCPNEIVRPFFARSAPPDWWRWDAEGHGDPSLTCTFLVSTPAGAAVLGSWECTFRGFLVIVSSCRFRCAQAPPLITLGC